MSPAPWPVIKRSQLDAIAAKVQVLRERMETARRLAGPGGETSRLLHKVYTAGPYLSREEFTGIAALQPLMAREFLAMVFGTASALNDARTTIATTVRRSTRLTGPQEQLLRSYWSSFWALGHLFVLAAMEGPEVLTEEILETFRERATTPSWALVRQTQMPLALRAAWAVGRLGKPLLRIYKTRYAEAKTYLQAVDAGLGLMAIGLRHERLAAEALKTLTSQALTASDHLTGAARLASATRGLLGAHARLRVGLVAAEKSGEIEAQPSFGARAWVTLCELNPDVQIPHRASAPEQVPAWLALAYPLNIPLSFAEVSKKHLTTVVYALETVACARAEELYLPREIVSLMVEPWSPRQTLDLVEPLVAHREPVRAAKSPGRNEQCACGSGKKYKRCCGAAA
jgi:hypothetical protein